MANETQDMTAAGGLPLGGGFHCSLFCLALILQVFAPGTMRPTFPPPRRLALSLTTSSEERIEPHEEVENTLLLQENFFRIKGKDHVTFMEII